MSTTTPAAPPVLSGLAETEHALERLRRTVPELLVVLRAVAARHPHGGRGHPYAERALPPDRVKQLAAQLQQTVDLVEKEAAYLAKVQQAILLHDEAEAKEAGYGVEVPRPPCPER
jgi:hypothetical protein